MAGYAQCPHHHRWLPGRQLSVARPGQCICGHPFLGPKLTSCTWKEGTHATVGVGAGMECPSLALEWAPIRGPRGKGGWCLLVWSGRNALRLDCSTLYTCCLPAGRQSEALLQRYLCGQALLGHHAHRVRKVFPSHALEFTDALHSLAWGNLTRFLGHFQPLSPSSEDLGSLPCLGTGLYRSHFQGWSRIASSRLS